MSAIWKAVIACYVLIIIVGLVSVAVAGNNANNESETSYQNLIHGCHRGNPRNRAYTLAVTAASENPDTPPDLHVKFVKALNGIQSQPFVRPDGSTECGKAYVKP